MSGYVVRRFKIVQYDPFPVGLWVTFSDPYQYKAQAIDDAQDLNRKTDHEIRTGLHGGHRYRVSHSSVDKFRKRYYQLFDNQWYPLAR